MGLASSWEKTRIRDFRGAASRDRGRDLHVPTSGTKAIIRALGIMTCGMVGLASASASGVS